MDGFVDVTFDKVNVPCPDVVVEAIWYVDFSSYRWIVFLISRVLNSRSQICVCDLFWSSLCFGSIVHVCVLTEVVAEGPQQKQRLWVCHHVLSPLPLSKVVGHSAHTHVKNTCRSQLSNIGEGRGCSRRWGLGGKALSEIFNRLLEISSLFSGGWYAHSSKQICSIHFCSNPVLLCWFQMARLTPFEVGQVTAHMHHGLGASSTRARRAGAGNM